MAATPRKAQDADPNATATTQAVESLNPAGTAPADPDQATVADAHAKHEEQRARAERTEAAMWDGVRAGLSRQDALDAARRSVGPAPENKAEGAAPENRST